MSPLSLSISHRATFSKIDEFNFYPTLRLKFHRKLRSVFINIRNFAISIIIDLDSLIKVLLIAALWKIVYLGQIDGVAVDQRHEHDDVPRRPSGSREDVQERRAEPQGVRDGKADDRSEYPEQSEQKTDQAHLERTTVEFGSSGSSRSR